MASIALICMARHAGINPATIPLISNTIEAYTAVAEYIAETFLVLWEEEFDKKIFIRGCPDFSWGKFRLESQGGLAQVEHRISALQKREGWAIVHRSSSA